MKSEYVVTQGRSMKDLNLANGVDSTADEKTNYKFNEGKF
jgi:hypothetical protein